MFDIQISEENRVFSEGTSEGTQDKYFVDGYWYKLDRYGGEGTAEELASLLLRHSNLKAGEYAVYESGLINGRKGCRSRHFLQRGESLITLYRLHQRTLGTNLAAVTGMMAREERLSYTVSFVKQYTGLDIRTYLANTMYLDQIILNEDRHFNNLSIIFSQKCGFRTAPIFDNGKSLLVGNYSCRNSDSLEEKVKKVVARPFSGSHEWNASALKDYRTIQFYVDDLKKELLDYPNCREKEVLLYQLHLNEQGYALLTDIVKGELKSLGM